MSVFHIRETREPGVWPARSQDEAGRDDAGCQFPLCNITPSNGHLDLSQPEDMLNFSCGFYHDSFAALLACLEVPSFSLSLSLSAATSRQTFRKAQNLVVN